jgi:hypothetical protein
MGYNQYICEISVLSSLKAERKYRIFDIRVIGMETLSQPHVYDTGRSNIEKPERARSSASGSVSFFQEKRPRHRPIGSDMHPRSGVMQSAQKDAFDGHHLPTPGAGCDRRPVKRLSGAHSIREPARFSDGHHVGSAIGPPAPCIITSLSGTVGINACFESGTPQHEGRYHEL